MEEIQYLTKESIYILHEDTLNHFGGTHGIYNNTDAKIESILSQQFPKFDYDKYPSVFQKAAMLLYFFVKDHCFVDGNKRIGIQSAILFLNLNGYLSLIDDDDGYDKIMEISTSQVPEEVRDEYIDCLAGWLCENFEKA
jgi:death-on-curing protein